MTKYDFIKPCGNVFHDEHEIKDQNSRNYKNIENLKCGCDYMKLKLGNVKGFEIFKPLAFQKPSCSHSFCAVTFPG